MKKNFLLVDDESVSNFVHRKLIERTGLGENIDTVTSGQDALQLINDCYSGTRPMPDVIFLDLNMPIMDGYSFLEAFNRLPVPIKKNMKVIIVTSSQDPRDKAKAKEYGITHFLSKPISEEAINQVWEG